MMNLFGQTKSNISRNASVLGAVGLSAIALFGITKPANAVTVALGSDYLITQSGTKFNFGSQIGNVNFQGNPINTFQGRNVGQADTIIQRIQDVNITSGSGNTPISIAALSLKSSAPVNLGGSNYDVFIGLNPNVGSGGTLTINSNQNFSNNFTVNFSASFVPQGGGSAIACPVGNCDFQKTFTGSGKWSQNFQGGTQVVGPVGDLLANVHTGLPSGFNDFYPVSTITHDTGGGSHNVAGAAPVPEPVSTMLGSILAFGVGAGLKNAYAKKSKNNFKAS